VLALVERMLELNRRGGSQTRPYGFALERNFDKHPGKVVVGPVGEIAEAYD